jgi:hypothetical protein
MGQSLPSSMTPIVSKTLTTDTAPRGTTCATGLPPALRSHEAGIFYTSVENRVLALRRWSAEEELLVFARLKNQPFASGYRMQNLPLTDQTWQEIFNSDAAI